MGVTHVGSVSTTRNNSQDSNPAILTIPADVIAGDTLLAVISVASIAIGQIAPTPTGWTKLDGQNILNDLGDNHLALFTRTAQTGDAGASVFFDTGGPANGVAAAISAFRGAAGPLGFDGNGVSNADLIIGFPQRNASRHVPVYLLAYAANAARSLQSSTMSIITTNTPEATHGALVGFDPAVTGTNASRSVSYSHYLGAAKTYTVSIPTNDPPSNPGTPSVSPNPVNTTGTISWAPSSDPDGDGINYHVDLSTDNGGSWKRIHDGGVGGATSIVYDFTAEPSTTAAKVRVIASDGGKSYTAWISSANFTIVHNVAPLAPALVGPNNNAILNRSQQQRFSWTFQDPNAGDNQSRYELRYRKGTGAWVTLTGVTPNTFRDIAAGTFEVGAYEWQVRTFDSQDVPGPWSESRFFNSAESPNAPVITAPTSGGTISRADNLASWSMPSQEGYEVRRVSDLNGEPDPAIVYWTSGQVVSAAATTVRDSALNFDTNNRYEHVQVSVRANGLWSAWASVRVLVSYTPPAVPKLTVIPWPSKARISVAYTQPSPTGTQPPVLSVDIWRNDGTRSIRIAKGLAPNATFQDDTPASGTQYTYRVRAYGSNGTTSVTAETA